MWNVDRHLNCFLVTLSFETDTPTNTTDHTFFPFSPVPSKHHNAHGHTPVPAVCSSALGRSL